MPQSSSSKTESQLQTTALCEGCSW
ncbi:hypothetical protein EV1_018752 [Malus domestica]